MAAVFAIFRVLENDKFLEDVGFPYGTLVDIQLLFDQGVQQYCELADLLGLFCSLLGKQSDKEAGISFWHSHHTHSCNWHHPRGNGCAEIVPV